MDITWDAIVSLALIIGIDLVLAGDNAIAIGLAAKGLPASQQKKAIFIGALGAVVIRAALASAIVLLMQIPWLHLVGGLLLVAISYRFLTEHAAPNEVKPEKTLWSAVRTIVLADVLMGMDNVLAIAGAADHHYLLIIFGLIISIPLIMAGSTLFLRLVDRFPWFIYVGGALLSLTAGKMIASEPMIATAMSDRGGPWLIEGAVVLIVFVAGWARRVRQRRQHLHLENDLKSKVE